MQHENTVSNMIYDIAYCVSFFSKVMTLHPGDIILTGTPGPAVIEDGDCIECHIEGMLPLKNKVKDMKKVPQQI
jgi:2-keto-4-pentenoate hydratase/2-oxohepta-3-ene-1,7-dioic acid hydratase in catechol pathway